MCGRFVLSETYRKLALSGCRMMRGWLSGWEMTLDMKFFTGILYSRI